MDQRNGQQQGSGPGQRGNGRPGFGPPAPRGDDAKRDDQGTGDRRRESNGDADQKRNRDQRRGGRRADRSNGDAPPPPNRADAGPPAEVIPPHPWDVYTDKFIALYKLSDSQTTAARAIVKGLKEREAGVRKTQISARAGADRLLDSKARTAKIAELDAPIDAMFKELKTRLDALLTAEQRGSQSPPAAPAAKAKK
jgi:hypothetical protein